MFCVNNAAKQTDYCCHLSLLKHFSSNVDKYQAEIHGAENNNLFTSRNKDQDEWVQVKSFYQNHNEKPSER